MLLVAPHLRRGVVSSLPGPEIRANTPKPLTLSGDVGDPRHKVMGAHLLFGVSFVSLGPRPYKVVFCLAAWLPGCLGFSGRGGKGPLACSPGLERRQRGWAGLG